MKPSPIQGGVRIDEDEFEKQKYEYQSTDANRKRGDFEKDLDNMLFGGGMPPSRRRQPQASTPAPPAPTTPAVNKSNETKPAPAKPSSPPRTQPQNVKPSSPPRGSTNNNTSGQSNVNKSTESGRGGATNTNTNANRSGQSGGQSNKPGPTGPGGKSVANIPINSNQQLTDPKKPLNNNYVDPKSKEPSVPSQPSPSEEINFQDSLKPISLRNSFNRPGFLRKGKKVAQDFNFATENVSQHYAVDVIRPFQTDRNRQQKLNNFDFKDAEFPGAGLSLGIENKDRAAVWKTPNQIARTVNFGKYIDPNDLRPGVLSSPHFVSTLSALSEYQANIKRLIQNQKPNSNGFYLIRLFINSVWRYIAVDNTLPYIDGENAGVISYPESDFELSTGLIEKAYAKAYGSYGIFSALEPRQNYLRDLTGAPVKKVAVDSSQFATAVKRASGAGQSIVAVPNERIAAYGLNPNLNYSVISLTNKGSLELRSSFGTTQQRSKLAIRPEGTFELSSAQIKEVLSHVLITTTNTAYYTTTVQARHRYGFYSTYNFKIHKQSHGFLTASQWDQRLYPQSAGYTYSPLHIILQRNEDDGSSSFVNASFTQNSRNTDLEVSLAPGSYTVFVAANWKTGDQSFNLSFYGSQSVSFERVSNEKDPNLIARSLQPLNLSQGRKTDLGRNVAHYFLYQQSSDTIIITVQNNSDRGANAATDLTRVQLSHLALLTSHSNEENYNNKVGIQIEEYKQASINDGKWSVYLEANTRFTWVFAADQAWNESNPRSWGFK